MSEKAKVILAYLWFSILYIASMLILPVLIWGTKAFIVIAILNSCVLIGFINVKALDVITRNNRRR